MLSAGDTMVQWHRSEDQCISPCTGRDLSMSAQNDSDRRTFLRATAMALAAGRFDMLRSWQQPLHQLERLAVEDELAALGKATAWINTPPLTPASLKGKVVLVQFWTLDRKSTRLNSSHDQISYAVFCLKKKKTKK